MFKNNRLNLLIGIAITGLTSAFAIGLLLNEYRRPVFAPANAWLWFSLLLLVPAGFAVAMTGMLRRIGCGYFIWSQSVLSFFVTIFYIGWYRRELDYVQMPDLGGPPDASLSGFLLTLLATLLIAFLPLAIRQMVRWRQNRKALFRSGPDGPA